jgi:hypothetical protein
VLVAASLILAFGRQNRTAAGVVLALSTVVAPAVYVLGKRLVEKVRQRETEARLLMQTMAYLESQESACVVRAVSRQSPGAESDIEILARVISGRKLATQDFLSFEGKAARLPDGEPVVFDALPRRYAIRTLYERRFADLAAALPKPVCLPLRALLPPAAR